MRSHVSFEHLLMENLTVELCHGQKHVVVELFQLLLEYYLLYDRYMTTFALVY